MTASNKTASKNTINLNQPPPKKRLNTYYRKCRAKSEALRKSVSGVKKKMEYTPSPMLDVSALQTLSDACAQESTAITTELAGWADICQAAKELIAEIDAVGCLLGLRLYKVEHLRGSLSNFRQLDENQFADQMEAKKTAKKTE